MKSSTSYILVKGGSKTVFVPGNCDPAELLDMEVDGALNLHGKRTAWRNHDLIGIGGSNPTPFQSLIAFSEKEIQRILSGLKASSNSFILSQVPPYGTRLDRVFLGRHVGSRALTKFIGEYNPLTAVVGHVHEGRGEQMLGSTVIVNPGPGARGFYGLMELGSDGVEVTLSQI
ncbi:MAG: YfcE family phosphodiesterase [Nitrososphaeria archaeon]|nr:YfcE family phosphodiesterase [Nitrososphaeria archaeon]